MADLPLCPNCSREQRLAGESSSHWAFRCRWCHTVRILSKPTLRGASQLEVILQRRAQQARVVRWKESRPAYSLPPAKESDGLKSPADGT